MSVTGLHDFSFAANYGCRLDGATMPASQYLGRSRHLVRDVHMPKDQARPETPLDRIWALRDRSFHALTAL